MVDGRIKANEDEDDTDFEKKQMDKFKDFSEELEAVSESVSAPSGVKIMEYNLALYEMQTDDVIMQDFALIALSVVFVLTYMTFHLKSFFLSSLAMLNIVVSFPCTLILFRAI